jgi:enoyl-CoA hydratase/3-hydroxyacyl-CoA dehydrogenase
MLAIQVNEATKILEEGVSDSPKDIDVAMANGGNGTGVFVLAETFGYSTLTAKLDELADKFGIETFRPTKTMRSGGVKLA